MDTLHVLRNRGGGSPLKMGTCDSRPLAQLFQQQTQKHSHLLLPPALLLQHYYHMGVGVEGDYVPSGLCPAFGLPILAPHLDFVADFSFLFGPGFIPHSLGFGRTGWC